MVWDEINPLPQVDPAENPATQHSGFTSEGWDKCAQPEVETGK